MFIWQFKVVNLLTELLQFLQVVGEAKTGDLCGEIGVLCYRPQLFTVRTKRLSQLLRLNRTAFLNIVQSNVGDGTIIMNNLLQVCVLVTFVLCHLIEILKDIVFGLNFNENSFVNKIS